MMKREWYIAHTKHKRKTVGQNKCTICINLNTINVPLYEYTIYTYTYAINLRIKIINGINFD